MKEQKTRNTTQDAPLWLAFRQGGHSDPSTSPLTAKFRHLIILGMEGQMLKGHLDMIVLAALSGGPTHGYAVIEEIRRRSGEAFNLPEGTVYPALHRLEAAGLLSSRWVTAETGRRRRIYALTKRGQRALEKQRAVWTEFSAAIAGLLAAPPT